MGRVAAGNYRYLFYIFGLWRNYEKFLTILSVLVILPNVC